MGSLAHGSGASGHVLRCLPSWQRLRMQTCKEAGK